MREISILYIVIAIIVFGFLIFTHELGHFLMAKKMGVTVNEFALGMGPVLFQKKGKETMYSLRLFPIGGYCQMEGEDEDIKTAGSFSSKSISARFAILFAGAAMNLMTGFILLLIMFSVHNQVLTTVVDSFKEGETPTQQSGLQVGDEIIKLNSLSVHIADDISYFLSRYGEEAVDITIKRDGEKILLNDVYFPYQDIEKSEMTGDIRDEGKFERLYRTDFYVAREDNSIFVTVKSAFFKSINTAKLIWTSFFDLVTGNVPLTDLAGPVGVTDVIGTAAKDSLMSLGNIVVLIAINLGVLNLLPLPALDGGRIVFLAVEGIMRKPVPAKYEGFVHFAGLVLLMGLSLLITFNDVVRLIVN